MAVKVGRFFSVVALKVGRFFFGCGTEGRSFLFGCGGFGSKVRRFVSPSSRGRDRFGPGAYLFVVLGISTFSAVHLRADGREGKPKCAFSMNLL